jgi:hypothetical protein
MVQVGVNVSPAVTPAWSRSLWCPAQGESAGHVELDLAVHMPVRQGQEPGGVLLRSGSRSLNAGGARTSPYGVKGWRFTEMKIQP